MNNLCAVCSKYTSSPYNFLLSCQRCHSFFHHRCHKPPVSDKELIEIIKHYNRQKQGGDRNPSFIWTCGPCAAQSRPPTAVPPPRSLPPAALPAHNRPPAQSSSREHPIIVLDSDDDSAPAQPTKTPAPKSRKTVSKPKPVAPPPVKNASKDVPLLKAPPTFLAKKVPSVRTIETRRETGIRIIDDPFIESLSARPVASPPLRPPLRSHSSAASSSSSSALLSAELGGLSMSTPELSHISTHTPAHQPQEEQNEWDLEYITPPAPPPIPLPSETPGDRSLAQPQRHVRIAQSLPPIAAIISNDDHEEPGDDDDEELEMDEIDATPAPTPTRPALLPVWINQHFSPPSFNTPRQPFSRKKLKSQNLAALSSANTFHEGSTSRQTRPPQLAPFFLQVDQWTRDKKRTLPD